MHVRINTKTKEILGVAQIDKRFKLPPHIKKITSLPDIKEGKARIFKSGKVVLVDDLRGKTYYLSDGTIATANTLDFKLPSGASFEPPPPSAEDLIAKIKTKAREIIYTVFSQERQNNANNRATKLTLKIARGNSLTSDEDTELMAIEAGSTWIDAVRAKSNELESDVETKDIQVLLDELKTFADAQMKNL